MTAPEHAPSSGQHAPPAPEHAPPAPEHAPSSGQHAPSSGQHAPAPEHAPTDPPAHAPASRVVLVVDDLAVSYRSARRRSGRVAAVDGISLELRSGELLALVGESGCGKTSSALAMLGLVEAERGRVELAGTDVLGARHGALRHLRRRMQLVYQDPYEALDPRWKVGDLVAEPLVVHGIGAGRSERRRLAAEALRQVGLDPPQLYLDRYPHELSGGQRQRVAIAASLVLRPELLVVDEPVSMLDVSVRAGILQLFRELRAAGLAVLMISHDLATVAHYSDRIAVMYLGRIVEEGPTAEVIGAPSHPYTRALLDAVPAIGGRRARWPALRDDELPDAGNMPSGCRFRPRCPQAEAICAERDPALVPAATPALVPGGDPALVPAATPALVPGGDPALVPGGDPALVPGGAPGHRGVPVRREHAVLTGYTDWPSFEPASRVPLRLSGEGPASLTLVRLRHGDSSTAGPGLVEEALPAVSAVTTLEPRRLPLGSYLRVPDLRLDTEQEARSFTCWVHPTGWPSAKATIVEVVVPGRRWQLALDAVGALTFSCDGWSPSGSSDGWTLSGPALALRSWQLVSAVLHPATCRLELCSRRPGRPSATAAGAFPPWGRPAALAAAGSSLTLAASVLDDAPCDALDGKLDAPALWAGSLGPAQLAALGEDHGIGEAPLRCYDFGAEQASVRVREVVAGADGELVNLPTRAVTGHAWRGGDDWRADPGGWSAVHFHADDLGDAGWPVSATLELPAELPNGVYAARVDAADGSRDRVPFVVRHAPGAARPALAVLLPTFTYLAYADEPIFEPHVPLSRSRGDDFTAASGLLSQYNWHGDGSGVVHASWLRPLLNLRPDYRYWLTGHPHGLGADLYLLDWLEHAGFACSVLTDHDLHAAGAKLLDPHTVLVTGSHPEYWTKPNAASLLAFLERGGRLLYAGGNGFGGYVGVPPEVPAATELRRISPGRGMWDSEPGESRLASNGELGGHGRHHRPRGRELTGVDLTGMGFRHAAPFVRTAASADPRVAFAFAGVGGPLIGDFGLHLGGAAGYEVDATDLQAGTPAHALVVATSEDRLADYESIDTRIPPRAEMTFFETPAGGAVFSVSSITWSGSLSHAGYDNDVARLTGNVLRRFLDPEPFLWPDGAP